MAETGRTDVVARGESIATTESMMGLSTFVLGTAFTVLPLVAAGLLAAMVLLERHAEPLAPASAGMGRGPGRARARQRKPGQEHACRRALGRS